jgi:hypothetical protein
MRPRSILAVLALVPCVALAQSLGEIAAREKARREKERQGKPTAKVYTEETLRAPRPAGGAYSNLATPAPESSVPSPGASPAAPRPAAPGAPPEKTEEEIQAEKAVEWRDRLAQAQSEMERLTERANRLQTGLNDMTGPIYGPGRAAQIEALEKTRQEADKARQLVADLEEEGRRGRYTSAPPRPPE